MQSGQLLCNRYLIEKALAAGGFGQTYLALDTHLPSTPQVVVKLLKPSCKDPATLKIAQRLFTVEAETLEQLGKDNDRIPSLYAHFESEGEFYLVQEFIAGATLAEEVEGKKISESQTLAIIKEILTGLSNVHCKNIIHRDLKPDNIIRRTSDGKLVLIDFGAVKQIRSTSATAINSSVSQTIGIGTAGYMPTEQSIGYPKPASDIYAVGAIGIQCLTGSQPSDLFNEDTLTIEWQHFQRINQDLARVLNKMVAPDYRRRYANATEALNAIELLITHQPTPKYKSVPKPIQPIVARSTIATSVVQRSVNKSSQSRKSANEKLKIVAVYTMGIGCLFTMMNSLIPKQSSIQSPTTSSVSDSPPSDPPSIPLSNYKSDKLENCSTDSANANNCQKVITNSIKTNKINIKLVNREIQHQLNLSINNQGREDLQIQQRAKSKQKQAQAPPSIKQRQVMIKVTREKYKQDRIRVPLTINSDKEARKSQAVIHPKLDILAGSKVEKKQKIVTKKTDKIHLPQPRTHRISSNRHTSDSVDDTRPWKSKIRTKGELEKLENVIKEGNP